ncbi:hypothetical protein MHK_005940, partial [Candidatus Magnetomorum sp. HK-1]
STSFNLTVTAVNDIPTISTIESQTINEDTLINSVSFTVTDIETAGCSHSITFASSDTTLVPVENISYTCSANTFYLSLTPAVDQTGVATITVMITDSLGLTSSNSFDLTIVNVNDAPVIGAIDNQSVLYNTVTDPIELTVTDIDGDSLSITTLSSDTSIVALENISISGTGSSRTMSITPTIDEVGTITVTVTVSDGNGLTSQTGFSLCVTPEFIDYSITKVSTCLDQSSVLYNDETIQLWGSTYDLDPNLDAVIDIDSGYSYVIVLLNDGTVWGVGNNDNGQLGNANNTDQTSLVQVSGLSNVTSIAIERYHSLALRNDGTVWAWGKNDYGQLGNGNTTDSNTSVQVSGLSNVITIACGQYHSIALKNDGTVWAWGNNSYGKLGDGTTTDRNTPVQMTGLSNIIDIASGSYHSMALKNDGTVWVCGRNISGQLGDGTTTNSSTPIQVASLSSIIDIAGGYGHSAAIKNDGTVWAWGANGSGQIGDNTTTDRTSPVQVLTVDNGSMIDCGYYKTILLQNDETVWAWGQSFANQPQQLDVKTDNYVPIIKTIVSQTVIEDVTSTINFSVSDLDSSACSMSISITSSDTSLVPNENISYNCDSNNYTITAIPGSNQNGIATITVTLTDSGSLTAIRSFDLTVTSVNDEPSISLIPDQTIDEDTATGSISFTVNDVDTNLSSLTLTGDSSVLTLVSVENINFGGTGSSRTVNITPTADQYGLVTITISVSDSEYTATSQFALTVTSINDTPQISQIDNQTIAEDTLLNSVSYTVTDVETSGCDMTVTYMSSNTSLVAIENITHTCNAGEFSMSISPTTNETGAATITILIEDAGGLTATESFVLTVNTVNDAPVISGIGSQFNANQTVLFSIADVEGGDITITMASSSQAMISDTSIDINGQGSNTYSFNLTSGVPQDLTFLTVSNSEQSGRMSITMTVTEADGVTTVQVYSVMVGLTGAGYALSFDGIDDYIEIPDHVLNDFDTNDDFTISFWVNVSQIQNDTGNTDNDLIEKYNSVDARNPFAIRYYNTNGKIHYSRYDGSNTTSVTSTISINDGKFHHIAAVKDASLIKLYIDGKLEGTSTDTTSSTTMNSSPIGVGARPNVSPINYFTGQIDELSIWNIGLDADAIRSNMCKKLEGNETGLVGYYRFDSGSGTTLTDLSTTGNNGTLIGSGGTNVYPQWVDSGAAIGDTSIYDYTGTISSDFEVSLAHADGDSMTAIGDSGTYSGIHLYLVNNSPNYITPPTGWSSVDSDHYWGVFPVGINPTYTVEYNYSGNTYVDDENEINLASRVNATDTSWTDINATLNTDTNILSQTEISAFSGISATEFVIGINDIPTIGAIADQTIDEDTIISALSVTTTDAETTVCGFGITITSSNAVLIPESNISYTCSAGTYYLSLTPATNESGNSDVTITITDSGNITAIQSFAITVNSVNDTPVLSITPDQVTDEDTSIASIEITATDIETAGCIMNITFASSDETLVPVNNISYTCNAGVFTLSITPTSDQSGAATITLTVADAGNLTVIESFILTVNEINDTPIITSVGNQTTEYICGQIIKQPMLFLASQILPPICQVQQVVHFSTLLL